jgi:hypothetical protein
MHNDPNHDPLTDPLTQELSSPSDASDSLDQRLLRALETAPAPRISEDFAARVAANLPAHMPASNLPSRAAASIHATHYGRYAMLLGIVLIFATMMTLAAHTAGRSAFELAIEWTLFAQFVALTVWFSAFRHRAS